MSDHGDGTQLSHGGPSVEVGILGGRFLGSERPDPLSKVIVDPAPVVQAGAGTSRPECPLVEQSLLPRD